MRFNCSNHLVSPSCRSNDKDMTPVDICKGRKHEEATALLESLMQSAGAEAEGNAIADGRSSSPAAGGGDAGAVIGLPAADGQVAEPAESQSMQ